MNEEKYLFNKNCFLPSWGIDDVEPHFPDEEPEEAKTEIPDSIIYQRHRKDLPTLLAELEDIENSIEEIKARQWHLAKLVKFHREGFTAR